MQLLTRAALLARRSWFSNPLTGMVESGENVNRELVVRAADAIDDAQMPRHHQCL